MYNAGLQWVALLYYVRVASVLHRGAHAFSSCPLRLSPWHGPAFKCRSINYGDS
jgi:hypothetical protein